MKKKNPFKQNDAGDETTCEMSAECCRSMDLLMQNRRRYYGHEQTWPRPQWFDLKVWITYWPHRIAVEPTATKYATKVAKKVRKKVMMISSTENIHLLEVKGYKSRWVNWFVLFHVWKFDFMDSFILLFFPM